MHPFHAAPLGAAVVVIPARATSGMEVAPTLQSIAWTPLRSIGVK